MSVQEIAQQQIAAGQAIGVSVLVLHDDAVEHQFALGSDESHLTTDSILLWLSSGKPLTAAAIALLVERRQLSLEDPIAKHIPEFAVGGKEIITLRHILTHTAGLHRTLPAAFQTPPWSQTIDKICQTPLPSDFTPGQHAAYDPSTGWFILGELIQRAAGQPFADFMAAEIFARCDMPNAAYAYSPGHLPPNLATYHTLHAGQRHRLNWNDFPAAEHPRPGASLRCPIADMARFYRALLTGKLLSAETVKLFTSPARGIMPDRTFGLPMDWGLGFMVKNDPRAPYSFGLHASASSFGHGGQQTSIAYADPDRNRITLIAYTDLPGERPHATRIQSLLSAIG